MIKRKKEDMEYNPGYKILLITVDRIHRSIEGEKVMTSEYGKETQG